ncbi:unnamed protein product, partial [Symbiodinium microadriaticum]
MLLPVAVKAATCASYDSTNESYCVSMNDGGCQGTVCDGVGITSVGDENVTNTTTTASNGASAQVVGCSKTGDYLAHADFSGKSEAVLKLLPGISVLVEGCAAVGVFYAQHTYLTRTHLR